MPRGVAPSVFTFALCLVVFGVRPTASATALGDTPLPPLPADTVGFVHVKMAEVWASPTVQSVLKQLKPEAAKSVTADLARNLGLEAAEVETITMALVTQPAGGREPVTPLFLLRTVKPFDRKAVLEKALPEAKEQAIAGLYATRDRREIDAVRFLSDRSLAFGTRSTLEFLPSEGPAPEVKNGPLAEALRLIPQHQYVAGAALPRELKALLQSKLSRGLRGPDGMAMTMFAPMLFSLEHAVLTMDMTPNLKVALRAAFDNEREATRAMRLAHAGIVGAQIGCRMAQTEMMRDSSGRPLTQLPKLLSAVEKSLDDAKVDLKGKSVELNLDVKLPEGLLERALLEAALRIRGAAEGMLRANNLRQILIAMHNYHNDYMKMPGDICDQAGKPLLSWRVQLLPYMEQDNLYRQFKLDEPWDSEHNKKFIGMMPKFYQIQGTKTPEPGMTYFQSFKAAPAYNGMYMPTMRFGPAAKQMTLGQMTAVDGTSNTIVVAEASTPVIWTKPDDIVIDKDIEDLNKPGPGVGAIPEDAGFYAAFGDASVRRIAKSLPDMKEHKKLLRQLIGVRDGENFDTAPILDDGSDSGGRAERSARKEFKRVGEMIEARPTEAARPTAPSRPPEQ